MRKTDKSLASFIVRLLIVFLFCQEGIAKGECHQIYTQIKVSRSVFNYIRSNTNSEIKSVIQDRDFILMTMPWSAVYTLEEEGVDIEIVKFDINDKNIDYPSYPTYKQVVTELKNYATNNPTLCKYEVIGKTQGGKDIPSLIITKDEENGKARPLYWISGATHGNEEMGTVAIMTFIKSLVSGYNSGDVQMNKMMEQSEWHLVPIFNVDGYISVRRTLKNGIDPNRSFGWQVGYKSGPDANSHGAVTKPLATPEIQAYAQQLVKYPFVIGVDLHTGQVANYAPWFADHDQKPEDQDSYIAISKHFAIAGDGNLQNGGDKVKKGMPGIQTDYGFSKSGTLSMCLELCREQGKLPSNAASIANKHVKAFQDVFTETQKGVMGNVTDKETNKPIYARISVTECGAEIYSSSVTGGYFKYIPRKPSMLSITAVANGYKPQTYLVPAGGYDTITTKNIEMTKDSQGKISAMSIDCLRCSNFMSLTEARQCLGFRDGKAITIQAKGKNIAYLVVDMGPNTPIKEKGGKEITVVINGSGKYSLFAGETLGEVTKEKSLKKIGDGTTTEDFDLKASGLEQARYLRLEVSTGSLRLDAIEANN